MLRFFQTCPSDMVKGKSEPGVKGYVLMYDRSDRMQATDRPITAHDAALCSPSDVRKAYQYELDIDARAPRPF